MKRSQRRTHFRVWVALAIVLPATIIAALVVKGQALRAVQQPIVAEAR